MTEEQTIRSLLLKTTHERDIAWAELHAIRVVIQANPEESTLNGIIALQAKFKNLLDSVVKIGGVHLSDWHTMLECCKERDSLLNVIDDLK